MGDLIMSNDATDVHFFVAVGDKEEPLFEDRMSSVPLVGQRVYRSHAVTGKGVTRTRYAVIRTDWSYTQVNDDAPGKVLQVILEVDKGV